MANIPLLDDPSRAALNQFGIDPAPFRDAATVSRVPRTRTRTSHGLQLHVGGGKLIGAVNAFSEQQARRVDTEWELHSNQAGQAPRMLIGQGVETRTLTISRFDLFTSLMEEAFGTTELSVLADQSRPFSLRTSWSAPTGGLGRSPTPSLSERALNVAVGALGRRVYEYTDCWFTSLGRSVRSDDNRIVNVNAEIQYGLKQRIL